MVTVQQVKRILKKYSKGKIVVTDHALRQAKFRNVNIDEVKDNIINPEKLAYTEEQPAKEANERKFNCYFDYGKYHAHRYILVVNDKCVVCTIIDVRRDWQKQIK